MKKALLVLTLLVAPGVFAATASSNSSATTTSKHKKAKRKTLPSAQQDKSSQPAASSSAQTTEGLSGNAVESAQGNAEQSLQNEMKNNVNAGSSEPSKGDNASTVYPRSADPDVRDSYQSENHLRPEKKGDAFHGNDQTRDREASTGSTTLDSFSGSSSLPADQDQKSDSHK
jgi:hypothetical protein